MVAQLKKGMDISLVHPIGQTLAIMVTKAVHEPLQKMLHAGEGMQYVYTSTSTEKVEETTSTMLCVYALLCLWVLYAYYGCSCMKCRRQCTFVSIHLLIPVYVYFHPSSFLSSSYSSFALCSSS